MLRCEVEVNRVRLLATGTGAALIRVSAGGGWGLSAAGCEIRRYLSGMRWVERDVSIGFAEELRTWRRAEPKL